MSEAFRAIRQLTQYVEQQLTTYQPLKLALQEVSAVLDSLPDRQRQIAEADTALAELQRRGQELKVEHERLIKDLTKQRQDLQSLIQKEQQDRTQAREKFLMDKREAEEAQATSRGLLRQLEAQLTLKRHELAALEQSLAETVKAALGKH